MTTDKDKRQSEGKRPDATKDRSPFLFWLVWIVWLPFLLPPIWDSIQAHLPLARLTIVVSATVLFVALYLWGTLQIARDRLDPTSRTAEPTGWWTLGALTVLSVVFALAGPQTNALSPFVFTTAYVAGRFSTREALPLMMGLILLTALVGWRVEANSPQLWQATVNVAITGVVTHSMIRTLQTGQELRAARAEIARLAATTERLRIARDLHDLLGHNLSLIALKSELARRVISTTPSRAATELGDIESVARRTLQEVREALAAYRQPTLANEMQGAREILAAMGIEYRLESVEPIAGKLSSEADAVLAWTLREGITNIIRHSRAQHCLVQLSRDDGVIRLEIIDDGLLPPRSAEGHDGSGLRGLEERVQTLGGTFQAGPVQGAGFSLRVSVPLAAREALSE